MLAVLRPRLRLIMVFVTMLMLVHGSWASLQHPQHQHASQPHSQLAALVNNHADAHCQQMIEPHSTQHAAAQHLNLHASAGYIDAAAQTQPSVDCQDCAILHHCGQLTLFDLTPQLASIAPQQFSLSLVALDAYQFNSIANSTQPLLRPPRD